MFTVTGHTPTDRAPRYLKQLVSHLGRKIETSLAASTGTVAMGEARAQLSATDVALVMVVSAPSEGSLFPLMGVLQGHLERFGASEGLATEWDDAGLAERYAVARAAAEAAHARRQAETGHAAAQSD